MAALEEQAGKYTALLRKYDDVVLAGEAAAMEKAGLKAEADALRARLTAVDAGTAGAGEAERARASQLFERALRAVLGDRRGLPERLEVASLGREDGGLDRADRRAVGREDLVRVVFEADRE